MTTTIESCGEDISSRIPEGCHMDITQEMHIAVDISSKAEVETMESYSDRIPYYISQDYTYIPIPEENKYFNTNQGWMRDLDDAQYISIECHLVEVLERLQELPFLLMDKEHNSFVFVNSDENKAVDKIKLGAPNENLSKESVKKQIKESDSSYFDRYSDHLHKDHIDLKSTNEAIKEGCDMSEREITSYSDRYYIVTISDINKREMKDMLYRLFAELVSNLGEKIETEYPDSDSILEYLNADTIGRWKKEQIEGLNIHISEHLNLIDMLQVIQASDTDFVRKCGFKSKDDVSVLSSINKVRNSVMHANRSLVYSRRDIDDVLKAVENAQRITSNME